ncbi:hypothetical protein J1605_019866 [Eschrichtius robustus]|uniref:Uncharacterized protein n=1 Tax=Eschrichtius robustus TaxID=9764 RepID=A0AB34HIF5_ESCRO|nr:hypothetical protein J1605_019866 [Eschrichtius robustus]
MPGAAAANTALEVGLRDNSGAAWNPGSFPGAPWNTRTGQRESVLRVGYRNPLRRRRLAQSCSAGRPGSLRRSLRSGRRPEPGGGGKPCLRPAGEASHGRVHDSDATGARAAGWAERSGAYRPSEAGGGVGPRFRRAGAGPGAPGSLGASRRFRLVRGVAAAKQGARSCAARSPAARRQGGGGAAAAEAQACGVRPAAVRGWRGEPERGATAALPTESGHRNACIRERAQASARASARGRGRAGPARPFRPHPPPPLPLATFLSTSATPRRAPTLSSCGSAVRCGGRSGPGRGMALLDLALEGMAVFGFVLFLVLWLMHFMAIIYT